MNNLRSEFITWYFNEFHDNPLYTNMVAVTEDSPWHREKNVGIHTDMVVAQYLARTIADESWHSYSKSNGHSFLLGAFASAFHDTGKPKAMQVKYSEKRGEYRSFNGHEPVSARMWENWAVQNWDMLKSRFSMKPFDIYVTGWMIENHLPWCLKKEDKVNNLALTVARNEIWNVFPHVLMADTCGRISDDHQKKIRASTDWVTNLDERVRQVGIDYFNNHSGVMSSADPVIVMPIAPSGAGKSTLFVGEYQDRKYAHYSLDEERMFYAAEMLNLEGHDMSPDVFYSVCWSYCKDHKSEFNPIAQKKFIDLIKTGQSIYVDNTNTSRKSRRFYLDQAKRRGYKTKAVLLPITMDEAVKRQSTREDKMVPVPSVLNQYWSVQSPWYGEFDFIEVKL